MEDLDLKANKEISNESQNQEQKASRLKKADEASQGLDMSSKNEAYKPHKRDEKGNGSVQESLSPEALSVEQELRRQLTEQQAKVEQLEEKERESKEALLRKQADFENYRRRMQKEKQEAIQFANRELIGDLLEVLDNFERASLSYQKVKEEFGPEILDMFKGVELIEQQLSGMLFNRWGLKAIENIEGQEFDPNFHEALMMEESGDYAVPTITGSLQTGYILNDRVLRHARVKVAKPAGKT